MTEIHAFTGTGADGRLTVDIRDGDGVKVVEFELEGDQAWRFIRGTGPARGQGTVYAGKRFDDPCTPDASCEAGQACEHHAPLRAAHPHVRNPELGSPDMFGNRPISRAAITAARMVLHERIGTNASYGETHLVIEYAAARFERGEIEGALDTLSRIVDRTGAWRLAAVLHAGGKVDL